MESENCYILSFFWFLLQRCQEFSEFILTAIALLLRIWLLASVSWPGATLLAQMLLLPFEAEMKFTRVSAFKLQQQIISAELQVAKTLLHRQTSRDRQHRLTLGTSINGNAIGRDIPFLWRCCRNALHIPTYTLYVRK